MKLNIKKVKFPNEKLPLNTKGKQFSALGAGEFVSETYNFLKTFYRGCYDAYLTEAAHKTLFICIENFAIVLKGLVKAVFGRELIIVKFVNENDGLCINMEFDTSVVSEEMRQQMQDLAKEGGFGVDFDERSASIRIHYISGAVPYVNSHSTRIVYNTLMSVFNNQNV